MVYFGEGVISVFLNDTVNETESETENETVLLSQLSKRQQVVLKAIAENDRITEAQMMQKFSVSRATITRATTALKKMGIIIRVGSDRNGSWMIVKKVIGLSSSSNGFMVLSTRMPYS